MNFFKFLYDVFVWLTNNYSKMPDDFKSSFPEEACVKGRLTLSDIAQADSDFNKDFVDYE